MTTPQQRPAREPLPAEVRRLIAAPALAIPTVLLFFACLSGLAAVSYLALQGAVPLWAGTLLNGIVVFYFFSVVHDSSHGAISKYRLLNDTLGRIGLFFFGPIAPLGMARWIHMQHHRFTNDEVKDPDYFGHKMDLLTLLRWSNFDYFYTSYFLKHAGKTMIKQKLGGLLIQVSLVIALVWLAFHTGWGWEAVALWLLPSRVSSFLFVLVFVWLPHSPFSHTAQQDEYKASNIRAGWEWLLTPAMTYQNYHLVHHLYPTAPFYQMLRIWNARRAYHLSREPYYVKTFSVTGQAASAPRA
jgi:beta-carotene hydroxylase